MFTPTQALETLAQPGADRSAVCGLIEAELIALTMCSPKAAAMAAGHFTLFPSEPDHGLSTSAFDGDAAWNCIHASRALKVWKSAAAQKVAA